MQPIAGYSGAPNTFSRKFRSRSILHRVSCGGIVLSAILFTAGFGSPNWTDSYGLWEACDSYGQCIQISDTFHVGWMMAVQAMECIALILIWSSLAVWLYQDFRSVAPTEKDNNAVEGLAGSAGVCGLIGAIIFGAKFAIANSISGISVFGHNIRSQSHAVLDWGFGLTVTASILVGIFASTLGIARRNARNVTPSTAATTGIPPGLPDQPSTVPPVMNPPGQAIPMQEMRHNSPQMASQIPVFYVMNQEVMVPVYSQSQTPQGPAPGGSKQTSAAAQMSELCTDMYRSKSVPEWPSRSDDFRDWPYSSPPEPPRRGSHYRP
ncbi:hypothetical protein BaRGS_00017920 [Batillaria attramentaria]|uniref:Transmembrane protein n=1 Tax=Batillaria attramentaria TaxID=370345 RepID=A0ABD0KUN0_9CAEN